MSEFGPPLKNELELVSYFLINAQIFAKTNNMMIFSDINIILDM